MHVVVNNLTAIRQKTGIGHYVTELLGGLRTQQRTDRFVTFPGPWTEAAAAAFGTLQRTIGRLRRRRPGPAGSGQPSRLRSNVHDLARDWAAWHFRTFWSGRSFDLYHEPNYIPFPCDRPTVATVCDLSVLLHPDWHPPDRSLFFEKHFEPGLARCAHLLTISEFTRRELIETFGIAPDRVTCTYLGIRAGLRPLPPEAVRPVLARLGLADEYLLHVGTLEPRKNLLLLMRAYVDLPASARERCPLVLAGGWGWNVGELAAYHHDVARHYGVRHLGYVADADLPALYNGARALVFPSYYEGFGLPPVEMRACGGAVIALTAGAVVETVGRHAHLVDAHDLAGWRDALRRVVDDDDWWNGLRRGGEAASCPFSWERCADETYRVYCAVVGKRQPAARSA